MPQSRDQVGTPTVSAVVQAPRRARRGRLCRLAAVWVGGIAGLALLAAAPAAAQSIEDLHRQMEELQRQVDTLERQQREEAERAERLEPRQREDAERLERIELEPPPAPPIASGSDVVRLAISGQVNRALMVVDDGDDTTLFNVDNNASSSRIRAIGERGRCPG